MRRLVKFLVRDSRKFVCTSIRLLIVRKESEKCAFHIKKTVLAFIGAGGFLSLFRQFHVSVVLFVLKLEFVCCNPALSGHGARQPLDPS